MLILAGPGGLALLVGLTGYSITNPRGGGLALMLFAVVPLSGFVVLPAIRGLWRWATGSPNLRIDERGLVWGRNRARDPAIDWTDIAGISMRRVESRRYQVRDQALIVDPVPGYRPADRLGPYVRVAAAFNRIAFDNAYVISTMTLSCTFDELVAALNPHLASPVLDESTGQRL